MAIRYLLLLSITLLTQSCCLRSGEEIDRVSFTEEEKAIMPYANNQQINMITNNGFQFQLNKEINSRYYSDQEHCEDYTSYESYSANLTSTIPNLNILLNLERSYDYINDLTFLDIGIEINNLYFYYDLETELETVDINGTVYTDVYRYYTNQNESPITEVLFNESDGILQINYLNGDYVQIDE